MLLAMLLAMAEPVVAPPAPPSTITLESLDSGPLRSDALDMARAAMPEASYKAMLGDMIKRGVREGFAGEIAAMEKRSPGVMAEIERSMVTISELYLDRSYRSTLTRYARLYTARLSPQDTADLTAFYLSPTGRKLIAQKYSHLAAADLPDGLVNPDKPATSGDIAALNRGVVSELMTKLSPADEAEILKMMKTAAFRKIAVMLPLINKLEADSANEADPEMEGAITKALVEILERRKLTP